MAAHYGFMLLTMKMKLAGAFPCLPMSGFCRPFGPVAMLRKFAPERLPSWPVLQAAAEDYAPLWGAVQLAHMAAGRNISVMMAYADRLERLAFWYRQLWAESLGKKAKARCRSTHWGQSTSTAKCSFIWPGPMTNFTHC